MTVANQITIARLFLIPVFVTLAARYGASVAAGEPVDAWRIAAVAVFFVAAASDGLDGWVARRFNQRSKLGAVLDPLADKVLVVAALVTLSVSPWSAHYRFPLWFPALVIVKDLLSLGGALLIRHIVGHVIIRPHWTGKVCVVALMTALGWVMLHFTILPAQVPVAVAAVFVVASGIAYIIDCAAQIRAGRPRAVKAEGRG